MLHVRLGRFRRVMPGMLMVTVRQLSVVSCFFMVSGIVVLGCFPVMLGSLIVMICSATVMLSRFFCHCEISWFA
jgi:hypothetical protein